jgi:RHS repeat-associated protein
VQKTASSATTQFVFDRAGHLLEETNGATGAAIREYIWLDDLPVAMVDDTGASPVLYYIHTDQLGTPQKITDGNANVVWEGLYDPFGNMITITGANWGTGVWGSFDWAMTSPPVTATNLRFPGQYADAETGLNQNWNRDYDPTIGRYVQSDPLGLLGGANTYDYASSNSETNFDPLGPSAANAAVAKNSMISPSLLNAPVEYLEQSSSFLSDPLCWREPRQLIFN